MSGEEAIVAMGSLGIIIAGVVVIIAGLNYRARMRELRHKERLAMIERGVLPPPDWGVGPPMRHWGPMQRSRSFGIVLIGLGFALMFLIGIAGGAADTGVGIGGAVAILGAAFIVRSIYAMAPPGEPRESDVSFHAPPPPPTDRSGN